MFTSAVNPLLRFDTISKSYRQTATQLEKTPRYKLWPHYYARRWLACLTRRASYIYVLCVCNFLMQQYTPFYAIALKFVHIYCYSQQCFLTLCQVQTTRATKLCTQVGYSSHAVRPSYPSSSILSGSHICVTLRLIYTSTVVNRVDCLVECTLYRYKGVHVYTYYFLTYNFQFQGFKGF